MSKLIDLTGERFGRLVVVERSGTQPSGHALWLCRCDCGNEKTVSSNQLRTGTLSCGCLQKEKAAATGMRNREISRRKRERLAPDLRRLHQTYNDMKQRCGNPNNKRYPLYGERGISVCEEWANSFPAFVEWAISAGYNNFLTLDRKDTDGNYEPSNCRWSTSKEQNNNRRNNRIVEYKGEKMTLHELSDRYCLNYKVLWARLNAGWDIEAAVETPIRRYVNGHYVV